MALDKAKKDTGEITTRGKYAVFVEANNIKNKAKKKLILLEWIKKLKQKKKEMIMVYL